MSTLQTLLALLDENHATDITTIDVHDQTTVTDYMVICSGRSTRQVKAIAEIIVEKMKAKGLRPLSQSGRETSEWILIDFGEVILHVMQPETRSFYYLEGLWKSPSPTEHAKNKPRRVRK